MLTRRTFVGSIGGSLAVATTGCLEAFGGDTCPDGDLGTVSGSWTTRGGNAGHINATGAGGFGGEPEIRWCTDIEGRLTSLLLADGRVYAIERVGDVGDRTFYLRANDASDGGEEWRRRLPEEPIAEAAFADGGIHVTMERDDADLVARYAASDGNEEWAVDFTRETDSMPAVADDTVYVVDVAGEVYAYEASSGTEQWSTRVSRRIAPTLLGNVPAVADGTVYVGTAIGKGPAAIDATDGTVRWQRDISDFFHPITDGDTLLGGAEDVLYALDAATGEARWKLTSVGSAPPALNGDTIFAFGTEGPTAYAATDGSRRWAHPRSDDIGDGTGLVATAGTLLVVGREGVLGIDSSSGEERWTLVAEVDRFVTGDGVAFISDVSDGLRGLAFP
jgi:outer membrane protein assembly factor BamB